MMGFMRVDGQAGSSCSVKKKKKKQKEKKYDLESHYFSSWWCEKSYFRGNLYDSVHEDVSLPQKTRL